MRYLLPILLRRYIKKKQQQFHSQFHFDNSQTKTNEDEGNVSISKKPKKSKTKTDDIGEYVDFEEIDD